MIDSRATCDRGRAWPSRSRTQGREVCFQHTSAPEDAEMRSATRAIRVCVVVESVIYGLRRRPVLNRYCDHATMAAAIAIVTAKDSHTLTSLDPRNP